jgi:D-glycero-alpha-D-manno-heptose-7-phosphate kinase
MIISKTPYRISFFGGGSDYPEWYLKNNGTVISTTINKYVYVSCRKLNKYFKHNYRVSYSKVEEVKKIDQILHPAVRGVLLNSKIKEGLEIHYDGDLPSRSGMGSSSSFVVGLENIINNYQKNKISKQILAQKSFFIERNVLKENVGHQDQIAASYGGFNKINFSEKGFVVNKIKLQTKFENAMNNNFFLVYTGLQRRAEKIAGRYIPKLNTKKKANIKKILNHVIEANKLILEDNPNDFGRLLHETWTEKKKLSPFITNSKIDEVYNLGIKNGSFGGKLLGAGGGGFILFYVDKNHIYKFKKKLSKFNILQVKPENRGSQIIHNEV